MLGNPILSEDDRVSAGPDFDDTNIAILIVCGDITFSYHTISPIIKNSA